ncbi:MAG: acyl CoA:acetate/3-ketoacid CoA transferase, partial [Thermoprotei archaeon]
FIESDTLPGTPDRGLDVIGKKLLGKQDQDFLVGILIPYFGFAPNFMSFVMNNNIEVYSWSIGIAAYWFREIASGRPGLVTKVGLHTFFDPRYEGGCVNDLAKERKRCKIEIIKLNGEEYLFYSAPKPNVAFIRGTTADELGNLSMEKEGMFGTVLAIAQASKAKPNPGIVIAQVERIAKFGSLNPQRVHVPGPLIDYIVKSPPEYHWQGGTIEFDARISGTIIPSMIEELPPLELTFEKVIARRVVFELTKLISEIHKPIIINLGVGVPALVSSVINEEELSEIIISTVESGPWGGIALSDANFGLSIGPFAIIPMPDQFTIYEGGILDATSLGFMQVDKEGNVNPSILPNRFTGPGGFPVIAAGSPKIYFAGGFTAGKRIIDIENGRLIIKQDGMIRKFVNNVYKIMFSGPMAIKNNKEVLYITERAVFRLTKEGLVLEEYAPGIDVEKDIINKMEFQPLISPKLTVMNEKLFKKEKIGFKEELKNVLK